MTGTTMNIEDLINAFEIEGKLLDATLRHHPKLQALFTLDFLETDLAALKHAYLQLLKLKADYVQHTTPALRAAGDALRAGDDEDRRWSERFLGYAADETDEQGGYGHHVWAHNDMIALGASAEFQDAPPHASVRRYAKYFIDDVRLHPYAILGAKGVLEHFSIRVSDDLVRGIVGSRIPNAGDATSFFDHHGLLDIDHVREGNRNLADLVHADKRQQILEGAYVTSGAYRACVRDYLGD